tara:strand:- start:6451 stop:7326 length:876 start_codon:yes stop_codon:yes gene_type:complete
MASVRCWNDGYTIYMPATMIAVAADLNKYEDVSEYAEKTIRRYEEDCIQKKETERLNVERLKKRKRREDHVKDVASTICKTAVTTVEKAIDIIAESQVQTSVIEDKIIRDKIIEKKEIIDAEKIEQQPIQDIVNKYVEKDITPDHLPQTVQQEITKERGTQNEKHDLKRVLRKDYTDGHTTKYCDIFRFYEGGMAIKFRVGAKVDAMKDGMIVESKSRKRRLFGFVPEYEKVQLHVYMKTFKHKNIKHIEHFSATGAHNEVICSFDPKFWHKVTGGLVKFWDLIKDKISNK